MITKDNLPTLLTLLNFSQNNNLWSKTIGKATLQVDFDKQLLIYPEDEGLIVNERQTCNFSDNENFVVFECVHRLLQKGYSPQHIELEKRWQLGHSQKSGRADICVYKDDDKNILLIIECKTYGKAYKTALDTLKTDGGQLFSYWQQDRNTQWLSLYASNIDTSSEQSKVIYKDDIIFCQDDENTKEVAQTDPSIALYQNATNVSALHKVWVDTYGTHLYNGLIFGEDSTAYHIGVKPLRIKDLIPFNPDDKLINQFEEILRHNAVSDKENAFNRLIALFICKLVDESDKDQDNEVAFQYKTTQDSYESLQDRLQRLYKDGMDKFMGEEIFYVADDFADDVFARYQGGDRKNAIDELKDTIKKLKFYTNGDFAFKEIHNRELFLQNGKILVEMVQLFEKYKIVYNNKDQFLGDLFEQLLNKGFKQNEGQFFTPQPITRFIWDSLPIQGFFDRNDDYPKVIDYACGSGHFLTEAVEAINAHKPSDNNDWTAQSIFGIEKDYRLARVSKVSMFMNGAGKSNIVFGDGLDNHEHISNEQFDILVANPPYSVKKFKSHLGLKNNDFALLDHISNDSGEIEVLFCERIKQLLKSEAIAAVILPSSILSNDSTSYTSARTLLLQHFYFRAIVNLGSKTFGATGTNTVILFLEKFKYPPTRLGQAKDTATAIFTNNDLTAWGDSVIYERYLQTIGTPKELYDRLRLKTLTFDELNAIDDEYIALQRDYILSKITLNKADAKLPIDEQNAQRLLKFWEKFTAQEQEKLQFFALTYAQKTLIINAPSDNAGQKHFLGYDWSNRKGNEGIQIINAGGLLYHHADRFADNTLASHIRQMFTDQNPPISEHLQNYAYVLNSSDMLSFDLATFNKAIKTSLQKKVEIESKYPLVKIGDLCLDIIEGKTPSKSIKEYWNSNDILWFTTPDFKENNININTASQFISNKALNDKKIKLIPVNSVLLSCTATLGKIGINRIPLTTNQQIKSLVLGELISPEFFAYYFQTSNIDLSNLTNNSGVKHINLATLSNIKIPLPPLPIQQQIVNECEQIDQEYENSRMAIETYRQKIAQIFDDLEVLYLQGRGRLVKIGELCHSYIGLTYKPEHICNDGVLVLRSSNIQNNALDFKDQVRVNCNIPEKLFVQEGDVLVCVRNGSKNLLGKSAYISKLKEPMTFGAFMAICRSDIGKWLHLCMQSNLFLRQVEQLTATVSINQLTQKNLLNMTVPIFSTEIQTQIIAQIETLENQIQTAQAIMNKATDRKKAVLERYLN